MTDHLRSHFRSTPIEDETQPFRVSLRTLPARLKIGPGARPRPKTPILFASGFASLFLIIFVTQLSEGLEASEIVAFLFILVVVAGLAAPWLLRRLKGVADWQRTVTLYRDKVEVTDQDASGSQRWSLPVSAYRLSHEHVRRGGFATSPAPQYAVYDMLILRHPDRSRDIPLRITPATGTGGMTMRDMIEAGRQGDKARVEAAMNDRDNPDFEAFKAYMSALLEMPVDDVRAVRDIA